MMVANQKNPFYVFELVLTKNNFQLNNVRYLQKLGTAMGTRIAPSYARATVHGEI